MPTGKQTLSYVCFPISFCLCPSHSHMHSLRKELRQGSTLRFEMISSVLSHCKTGRNASSIKCKCHKKCTGFNDDNTNNYFYDDDDNNINTHTHTHKKIMTCHYTLLCEKRKKLVDLFLMAEQNKQEFFFLGPSLLTMA